MAHRPPSDKKLIAATRPFQSESLPRSWWEFASTFLVYGMCIAAIFAAPWWVVKIAIAVFAGAVQFRFFSQYHDHLHGSLLSRSKFARKLMSGVGLFILTPRGVWRETHNFHHANNGKIEWSSIGSFPVMTIEEYEAASPKERFKYRWRRHPLALLFGYITIGVGGMCIEAFLRAPKRHWIGPVALVLHFGAFAALIAAFGLALATAVWIVPIFVNHALASYLFYAQHNFPGTRFFPAGKWNYTSAALDGSSYLKMGRLMRWLTGNIGYHHIHHLNARIPGYRLPEAMESIEALQSPQTTTFHPRDMIACLRLRFWNPTDGCMQRER